ncbi:MAG: triose-phosphate isomerase, partial [Candidatus Saccharicenans sp.]
MNYPQKPVIAGNWKMYKTVAEARELASAVVRGLSEVKNASLILIPPFTAIKEVKRVV